MREAEYMTMIDPFQDKLGDWMGALLVLPAVGGEIFWSAAILGALGNFQQLIARMHRFIFLKVIVMPCASNSFQLRSKT